MSGTANAQAARTLITPAASIDLGIADICYARGILPKDSFQTVNIEGLEDFQTKMLVTGKTVDEETQTISDWMTISVHDALKSGYASKLFFGLARDPDCRNILEEYVFMFDHDESGNITLASIQNGNGKKRSTNNNALKKPSVLSAKKQVGSLLRAIISVTSTLEPVPDERFVFAKMEFSSDCPVDYQPPGFKDARDNAVGFFNTKPFTMKLGALTTPYHNVTLGVRSVLDQVDVEEDMGPMGDNASKWDTTMMTRTCDLRSGHDATDKKDENTMGGGGSDGGGGAAAAAARGGGDDDDLIDLYGTDDFPPRYQRLTTPVTDIKNLSSMNGGPNKSCAGGIHSVPGSLCTQSHAAKPNTYEQHTTANDDDDDDVVEMNDDVEVAANPDQSNNNNNSCNEVWAQTQVSMDDGRRKRKMSIVEQPIHQCDNAGKRQKKMVDTVPTDGHAPMMPVQVQRGAGRRQRTKPAKYIRE